MKWKSTSKYPRHRCQASESCLHIRGESAKARTELYSGSLSPIKMLDMDVLLFIKSQRSLLMNT